MFDIILFDLDGTLSDSGPGITRCVAKALAHFGIHKEPHELTAFVGPPPTDLFQSDYGLTFDQAMEAMEIFRSRFSVKGILENAPYPDIPELLKELHGLGKRLCVATSKPRVYAQHILEKDGLAQYFEIIMGSELSGERVEKAAVINELLQHLGDNPDTKARMVMVGDRKYDVIGAKAFGLRCIGVEYGYAESGELQSAGADFCVPTVDALRQLLIT